MAAVIYFCVAAVAVAVVAWQTVRARRKTREMSATDQERMKDVRRRLRKSPVRYLSSLATAVVVLAVNIGTWEAWVVALVLLVVALVLVDRHRRTLLREAGFHLTWWGDPDYGKGTAA